MRISDWSSDVCSSDLAENETQLTILDVGWEVGQLLATDCWLAAAVRTADPVVVVTTATVPGMRRAGVAMDLRAGHRPPRQKTGRSSWRDRVGTYVLCPVVDVSIQKKHVQPQKK